MRKYVDLLIQHRYVKSMEVHVSRFAKGFSDIINSSRRRILFFESLELEDFNGLLCGSEKPGELTPIIMVIKKRTRK